MANKAGHGRTFPPALVIFVARIMGGVVVTIRRSLVVVLYITAIIRFLMFLCFRYIIKSITSVTRYFIARQSQVNAIKVRTYG